MENTNTPVQDNTPGKGELMGECYRSCCTGRPALMYNQSTEKHYCVPCSQKINMDNHRDAYERFGTSLCIAPNIPLNFKVIGIDNLDRESVSDILIAQDLTEIGAKHIAEKKNKEAGENAYFFYKAVDMDRPLWDAAKLYE